MFLVLALNYNSLSFFNGTGVKFRDLHLLISRCLQTYLNYPTIPLCVVFGDRVSLCALASLDHDSPICAPHVVRMIGACHCAWLLVEMGSCELFTWTGLEL
jgi:hypothetical protein